MPFEEFEGDQPSDSWGLGGWWDAEAKIRPEVLLRQVAPNRFQLVRGFRYKLPEAEDDRLGTRSEEKLGPWNVPAHVPTSDPDTAENWTDLASVPRWLWWFISSHGRHSRAALLHDYLIGPPGASARIAASEATEGEITDREADHVFRMALREAEVPILRRWLMWDAVSLASLWRRTIAGKTAVVAFALHVLAFVAALAYAMYVSWGWLGEALAWPFTFSWSLLSALGLSDLAAGAGERLWGAFGWLLPSQLEGPWWRVALLGLTGLVIWRKRWLITLVGLVLIVLPTLAVFASYVLAWLVESLLWLAVQVPGVNVSAPRPAFGKPYRDLLGRM